MSNDALTLEKLYTYADYLTWNVTERFELIKGKIFKMSPAPNLLHQKVSIHLSSLIFNYLKDKKCRVFAAPFDVRLMDPKKSKKNEDIYTVVQPDICVICDESKLDKQGCIGAPDLVVEILSPSTASKDTNEKYQLYQENGVKEYWVVFPAVQLIQVFDLDKKGKYQLRKSYARTDKAPMGIFKDFEVDLSEVFEELKEGE